MQANGARDAGQSAHCAASSADLPFLTRSPACVCDMTDRDLAQRLDRLKGSRQPSLPLQQLQERVARLKGLDPDKYSAPPITVYSADRRSDQEKADDLLSQMMHESSIETRVSVQGCETEVAQRLHRMRSSGAAGADDDSSSDSENEADKVVAKALAEAQLPPSLCSEADHESMEMPWCVICNEDAGVCCSDCDNDLYCNDCFAEFHSDADSRRHRTRLL